MHGMANCPSKADDLTIHLIWLIPKKKYPPQKRKSKGGRKGLKLSLQNRITLFSNATNVTKKSYNTEDICIIK